MTGNVMLKSKLHGKSDEQFTSSLLLEYQILGGVDGLSSEMLSYRVLFCSQRPDSHFACQSWGSVSRCVLELEDSPFPSPFPFCAYA